MIRNAAEVFMCVIDLQEKLLPAMGNTDTILPRIKILLGGAAALNIPFIATEQYPKGLGSTIPEIKELFPAGTPVIEKNSFSCFGAPGFAEALAAFPERKVLILCGVESHVCVLQTAADAIAKGYKVVLVDDCVDSRHATDKAYAVEYLRQSGVEIVSSEMILFMLLNDSKNPAFKTISKLVR